MKCPKCEGQMEMDLNTLNSGDWYCYECSQEKATPTEAEAESVLTLVKCNVCGKTTSYVICTDCGVKNLAKVQKDEIEFQKEEEKKLIVDISNDLDTIPRANIWTDNMIENLKEIQEKYKQKREDLK